jgi:hypothetical protein
LSFQKLFQNPDRSTRPFRIVHDFGVGDAEDFEHGMAIVQARLDELQSFGFSGVTVNVPFTHYLESEAGWRWFDAMVEAVIARGMRLWLYDEKGYPSGGAGGITLRDHPEFEASGLAMLHDIARDGEAVSLKLPWGHDQIVAAAVCPGTSAEDMDTDSVEHFLPDSESGTYRLAPTVGRHVAMLFAQKRSYEGTHAHHNVCAKRRYINVAQKAAVDAFIDNTYRPYAEHVGRYYGHEIEAIFTDEPSYMTTYLNAGLEPDVTDDPVDDTIPLLPTVPWGDNIAQAFLGHHGYDLLEHLPCLFGGHSRNARRVRIDYYRTLSALYEDAFFKNLSDVCAAQGFGFSGHVLLEDRLYFHVLFQGDMMQLLRHMHIPGIDLITARPENAWADACTPKLAASVAHLYGKPHVMSESSSHGEMVNGCSTLSFEQQMCTVAMQYALGVDMLHSYFADQAWTTQQNRTFCDMIGRLGGFVQGGILDAQVAVFYPFDTMAAYVTASDRQLFAWDGGPDVARVEGYWQGAMHSLMGAQVDFELLGMDELAQCSVSGGCLRHPCGSFYRVLVLPHTDCLGGAQLAVIDAFRQAGGSVVLYGAGPALCASAEEDGRLEELRRACPPLLQPGQLLSAVLTAVQPGLTLDKPCPRLVAMHRVYAGRHRYLLVNSDGVSIHTGIRLAGTGSVLRWNAFDGACWQMEAESRGLGTHLTLELEPYGVCLFTVGMDEAETE